MDTTSCELGYVSSHPMRLYCDNHAIIYIASNPKFHEKTEYIEVDCFARK